MSGIENSSAVIWWIPLIAYGVWTTVLYLISRVSGWAELADGARGDQLFQHQAGCEDHEIMAIDAGEMLRLIERLAPARKGCGQRFVIHLGREARILEQQIEVAFERPHDGSKPPRLVRQVGNRLDLGFERGEHALIVPEDGAWATPALNTFASVS